jgi:hypothetical protein
LALSAAPALHPLSVRKMRKLEIEGIHRACTPHHFVMGILLPYGGGKIVGSLPQFSVLRKGPLVLPSLTHPSHPTPLTSQRKKKNWSLHFFFFRCFGVSLMGRAHRRGRSVIWIPLKCRFSCGLQIYISRGSLVILMVNTLSNVDRITTTVT